MHPALRCFDTPRDRFDTCQVPWRAVILLHSPEHKTQLQHSTVMQYCRTALDQQLQTSQCRVQVSAVLHRLLVPPSSCTASSAASSSRACCASAFSLLIPSSLGLAPVCTVDTAPAQHGYAMFAGVVTSVYCKCGVPKLCVCTCDVVSCCASDTAAAAGVLECSQVVPAAPA